MNIVENPSTPPDVLGQLLHDKYIGVVTTAIETGRAPLKAVFELAHNTDDGEVIASLAILLLDNGKLPLRHYIFAKHEMHMNNDSIKSLERMLSEAVKQ